MSSHVRGIALTIAGSAILALSCTNPAVAVDIEPTFSASITSLSDASAVESAIDSAASTIGGLFSNSFDVPIYFEAVHDGANGFLAASESTYYGESYSSYTGLLKSAAAANPANTTLNMAVANLAFGNQGGTDGVAATNTVLEALGVPAADVPGAYGGGAYDGVILINVDQPLTFTRPIPAYNGSNLTYDGTSAIEHEIDEVLGGGGSGSTLNDVALYGKNSPSDAFTYYEGPLDLYRYGGAHKPSFSTSSTAQSYFSVNGGETGIVQFNQLSQGDMGDFGPTTFACSAGGDGGPHGLIQDAFSCNNTTGEPYTSSSIEYEMLESLGYDPLGSPGNASGSCCVAELGQFTAMSSSVPEASTWALMLIGFAGLGFAGYLRPRVGAPRQARVEIAGARPPLRA